MVVEHAGSCRRRHNGGHGCVVCVDATRSQAPARLSYGRKYRHHLYRPGPCPRLQGIWHVVCGRARTDRGIVSCLQSLAIQKPSLFGAGAVLNATGERDMEHLGGLIHRMPQTAFVFLVGCVAISALPPLNGFVSEWLTFQAILISPQLPAWGLKLLVPAVGALLALSAALAAACFVKAFGVSFLGRARTPAAA